MVDIVTDKKIKGVQFTVVSPAEIRKLSSVKVTIPDTYNDDGYPIENGLIDTRMGIIDPGLKCMTCGARMGACPGHFGHIELIRPVIHPLYSKILLFIMQSTCNKCHKLVFDETELTKLKEELKVYEKEDDKKGQKTTIIKFRTKKIKGKICPHCGHKQEDITLLKPTTFYKGKQVLLATEVREWMESVSNADLRMLYIDPLHARPEWMILTVLMVPPVNVRPSITLETGERSEDDLTHKLVDIIRINQRLEMNINAGAPQLIIEDLWELLQYHVSTYFNNELPNMPPARHRSGRALKTLTQRLKGKEGRFRYNLSGKRVNFSARTVISPDPRLDIDEVGVPQEMAEQITVPVKITTWNIEEIKKYILSEEYPKALYIIMPNGHRIKIGTDTSKQEVIDSLIPGCIVERQLINGDITLFNRQPSLHRISMMGHVAKILPGKTLRINPAVCPPYNADFDGDEMNLHILQNIEAQVEANQLMIPYKQVLSPRHGKLIIAPNEDHISGAFKITYKAEFDKVDAAYLLSTTGIKDLPEPDKGDKYSGKLLFSLLIPEEIEYSKKTDFYSVDHDEGEVIINRGVISNGALDVKSYTGLGEMIAYTMGFEASREFINRSTRMSLTALKFMGFSIGLKQYELEKQIQKKVKDVIANAQREIDAVVMRYKNKTLERAPGQTLRETVENEILMINGKTRKLCGKIIESSMTPDNNALIVAKIKARGSIVNTINMSGMVGQQSVRGSRLTRGYKTRTLIHFEPRELGACAKGFIPHSFYEGLTPVEHFFQSMGGRDSMVIKALRTGRSGYMQRRMIHALQDIYIDKDLTVRELSGKIIQFSYGGDGIDPMFSRYKLYV